MSVVLLHQNPLDIYPTKSWLNRSRKVLYAPLSLALALATWGLDAQQLRTWSAFRLRYVKSEPWYALNVAKPEMMKCGNGMRENVNGSGGIGERH